MKKMSAISITVVLAVILCGSAVAADRQIARATIPFNFSANDESFAAGQYEVRQLGASIIRLQAVGSGRGVTLLASQAVGAPSLMKLTFRRNGASTLLLSVEDPASGYSAKTLDYKGERRSIRLADGTIVSLIARR